MTPNRLPPRPAPYRPGWEKPVSTPQIQLDSTHDSTIEVRPIVQPRIRTLTKEKRRPLPIQTHGLREFRQRDRRSSAEFLLTPPSGQGNRAEDPSPLQSPTDSSFKRSSDGTDHEKWDVSSPITSSPTAMLLKNSFNVNQLPFALMEELNTQTVSAKYNISPNQALLLYPEDVEKDDWLHNPDENDPNDECRLCSGRGIINCLGLGLVVLGVLALFIGYPVLTFVENTIQPEGIKICEDDPLCIRTGVPLLKNSRTGLIDPDTPKSAYKKTSYDGKDLQLVFSDEFNLDGRTFYSGDDPFWAAVDLWYGVTGDLEWYDPDAIWTENGTLNIRFDAFQNHNLNYRSGMLQSWNKLCFKGGRLEASISLPGRGDTIGFWPGFWAMGNLGRPGYAATTDGLWPYSYEDVCDAGITPNQSDPTGINFLPGLRLPACSCRGEDHPTPGKSRSAPEIDVIEASVQFLQPPNGKGVGTASQSIQTAPFDVFWRPDYDFLELYNYSLTTMNSYAGSVYQQAISGVTNLNDSWYDGVEYQLYAFEYEPGAAGKVTWFVGDAASWTFDARSVGPNGNIGQRIVPEEPMAIVVNFGMSAGFASLDLSGLGALLPATMRIDYIRIYQEGDGIVTCDPPGYETTGYIQQHGKAYNNQNVTQWAETGYKWPKNSLMNGCTAENYSDE